MSARTLFAALCLSLAASAPAWASAPAGGLGGVVTQLGEGTPLPNVEVTLHHAELPDVQGRTDDLGRFRFHHLPPGLYRLEARLPGFELRVVDPVVVPEHLVRSEHVVLERTKAPPVENT